MSNEQHVFLLQTIDTFLCFVILYGGLLIIIVLTGGCLSENEDFKYTKYETSLFPNKVICNDFGITYYDIIRT